MQKPYYFVLLILCLLLSNTLTAQDDLLLNQAKSVELTVKDQTIPYDTWIKLPLTLENWPAFAKEKNITFQIEDKTIKTGSGGGSACAHAAVCVILIPAIALDFALNRRRVTIVEFEHQERLYYLEYLRKSKLLVRLKIDAEPYVYPVFFNSLNKGYMYMPEQYPSVRKDILEKSLTFLNSNASLEKKYNLLKNVKRTENNDTNFVKSYYTQNNLSDQAKAAIIQVDCSLILQTKYQKETSILVNNAQSLTAQAISKCINESNNLSELSSVNNLQLPEYLLPIIDLEYENVCHISKEKLEMPAKRFENSIELEKISKSSNPCDNKTYKTLSNYYRNSEIKQNEYIDLVENYHESYKNFLESNETLSLTNNRELILAKLNLKIREPEKPGQDSQITLFSETTNMDRAFEQADPEILQALLRLYTKSAHARYKLLGIRTRDKDITRQAKLLNKFVNLEAKHKSYLATQLLKSNQKNWTVSELALLYVLNEKPQKSLEKSILSSSKKRDVFPKRAVDVSAKISKNKARADLAYYAMHLAGFSDEDIQAIHKRVNK